MKQPVNSIQLHAFIVVVLLHKPIDQSLNHAALKRRIDDTPASADALLGFTIQQHKYSNQADGANMIVIYIEGKKLYRCGLLFLVNRDVVYLFWLSLPSLSRIDLQAAEATSCCLLKAAVHMHMHNFKNGSFI